MMKKILKIVLALIVISFAGLYFISLSNDFELGMKEGKFAPCPESPNCISSFENGNESKFLEEIKLSSGTNDPIELLKNSLPSNSKIITEKGNYIHCEFKEGIWTDDVEFQVYPEKNIIHFRSSSRWGHDDLGANRRRMEKLKNILESSF